MTDGQSPRPISHVGVSVLDLDRAIEWYGAVLGFRVVTPPAEMHTTDPQLGAALADMMGSRTRRFRMAHVISGNGVGLQLFEYLDPPARPAADPDAYWETGLFHICVTDPDPETLAQRIVEHGGTASRVWRQIPDAPYAAAYCRDPFGNVIEINSHGYEETRTFLEQS